MSKPSKPIPKFSSEAEERAFWESPKNDSTQYVDWTEAKLVTFSRLRPPHPQTTPNPRPATQRETTQINP
jgi:hypothetical protein